MNIKTLFAAAVVAGASFAAAAPASAMPVAPQSSGIGVEQVRFGCPRGYTPNRYGRCQFMTGRGRYYRSYRRW